MTKLIAVPLLFVGLVLMGCSKKPEPEVVPTPVEQPVVAIPTPPPPPPVVNEPSCASIVQNMVTELGALVHFDTDKFDIRPMDAATLDRKALVLQSHSAVRVRLTGHADERHTAEYNLVLGSKRSESAKDYLVGKGIDRNRIETATLGETAPINPGHDESAWWQNRRAELTVIAGRETLASHLSRCR